MTAKQANWVDILLGAKAVEDSALNDEERELAEVLGVLGDGLSKPAQPPHALRKRLISSLCSPRYRYAPFMGRISALFHLREAHAEELLTQVASEDAWQPSPWPNVEVIAVSNNDGAEQLFARVSAGAKFPLHKHLGEETYLVLQGVCREDNGFINEPGDMIVRSAGSVHSFEVIGDKSLIFAIEHRGLEFDP